MDGFDLLVTIPTSLGKTGYLVILMLVVCKISADVTLALGEKEFPKDPAMIIVCPTKALEDDMVCVFWWSCLTNIINIQKGISNAESWPDGHHHQLRYT